MCSLGKAITSLTSVIIVLVIIYFYWKDLHPVFKDLWQKALMTAENGIGQQQPGEARGSR